MKNLFLCLIMFFAFAVSIAAQENFLQTVLVEMPNKTAVSFEPAIVSPDADVLTSNLQNLRQSATGAAPNRVTRFLSDAANGVVFGYTIAIEPLANKKYRVSLEPIEKSVEPPRALLPKSRSLAGTRRATTILTLPNVVWTQTVAEGDALTIDLLEHPGLNIKIVDKIRVAASRERLVPPVALPRDFTLNDLPIAVSNLKLRVNDDEFQLGKTYSGSLLWLHLPAKGFFLISLVPRDGYDFRKIGTVNNNEIAFEFKGDRYKLTSDAAILPEKGAWFVWVLHDPKHTPFFVAPPIASRTNRDKPSELKNPFERNGSLAKPDDKSAFDPQQPQPRIDQSNQPDQPAPRKPVAGAVKDIQTIYPKN